MNLHELVREWGRRARSAQMGHYRTAIKLEARHRWLGVTVAALTAIVGTTVFASLSDNLDAIWVRVAVGFVSISTAVLAGVQTFERAGERAEKHRLAATQFSSLQRDAELFVAGGVVADEATQAFLKDFNTRYGQLTNESPSIDEKIHRVVKREIAGEVHAVLGAAGAPAQLPLEAREGELLPGAAALTGK
jgi:hypothetical protein